MNSAQRHEARYQRRKKKREEKRQLRSKMCGELEQVFSYEHLYKCYCTNI